MTAIHYKPTVFGSEANPKQLIGLIVLLVMLLHALMVLWVRNLEEPAKPAILEKIMQISLLDIPKPKPIIEPPPPPEKPAPAKVLPVKKPPVKPPVKKVEPVVAKPLPKPTPSPVVHKQGEIKSDPTPAPVVRELAPPVPFTPFVPVKPIAKPAPVAQPAPAPTHSKPAQQASDSGHGSSGVVELGCRKPKYPSRALERELEGKVTVELTVDADGEVTNANVVKSEPDGVFDDAALSSAETCRFKPKIVNGQAVAQRATKTITFKLPPQ